MSQLHGKQIKKESIDLEKLSGSGVADILGKLNFGTGAKLTTKVGNILNDDDVVNKSFVESLVTGLDIKQAVRVLSDSNITLTSPGVIDGVTLAEGDRVLVNGQTSRAENGIYILSGGSLVRTIDFDEDDEVTGGQFTFVKEGSTYADTGWVVSTPDSTITIDTDDIEFTQFSSAGLIQAGAGLTKTGNIIDIEDTGVTSGDYGSSSSTLSFNVNSRGQITSVTSNPISITASQISDFSTSVKTEIFKDVNFVDSDNINFDVTSGSSVKANVILESNKGLTSSASGLGVSVDGSTITINPSGQLEANGINVEVGDGVSKSVSGDDVTISIENGKGLKVNPSGLELDLDDLSGLGFEGVGVNGKLKVLTDDETITIDSTGKLKTISGSAKPTNDSIQVASNYVGSNGAGVDTTLALSKKPSQYSRIVVYVNGHKQNLGSTTSDDCWFGTTSSAKTFDTLDTADKLFWNASSAGFELDSGDLVEISYEA